MSVVGEFAASVNPSILDVWSWVVLCCISEVLVVLYSAGSGVSSVHVVCVEK